MHYQLKASYNSILRPSYGQFSRIALVSLSLSLSLSLSHTHTHTGRQRQRQRHKEEQTQAQAQPQPQLPGERERERERERGRGGERDQLLALVAFTPFPDIEDDVLTCNLSPHTNLPKKNNGLQLLVYQALSYQCIRPSATSVCGLKLLVYVASKVGKVR
jgi:hypothetical protein